MGRFFPVLAALVGGLAIGLQGAINSELARHVGRVRATLLSVLVSTVTVLLVLLLRPESGSFAGLLAAPRWSLLGGICGVIVLLGTIIAVPRIGVAATTGVIVLAQLLISAIIDHFGLLGVAMRPVTPGRLGGLTLLLVAVLIVVRS